MAEVMGPNTLDDFIGLTVSQLPVDQHAYAAQVGGRQMVLVAGDPMNVFRRVGDVLVRWGPQRAADGWFFDTFQALRLDYRNRIVEVAQGQMGDRPAWVPDGSAIDPVIPERVTEFRIGDPSSARSKNVLIADGDPRWLWGILRDRRLVKSLAFLRRCAPDESHGVTQAASTTGGVILLFTNELTSAEDHEEHKYVFDRHPEHGRLEVPDPITEIELHYNTSECAAFAWGMREGEFDHILVGDRPWARETVGDEEIVYPPTAMLRDTKFRAISVRLTGLEIQDIAGVIGSTLEFPDPALARMNLRAGNLDEEFQRFFGDGTQGLEGL